MPEWIAVAGIVREGHRVASGLGPASPYPAGTIALQTPVFAALGLDLTAFYPGTINVDVSPHRVRIVHPVWHFENIRWTDRHPPETFSFADARLRFRENEVTALLYYPHPETKVQHFQKDTTLEVLASFLPGLRYGDPLKLWVNPAQVEIR